MKKIIYWIIIIILSNNVSGALINYEINNCYLLINSLPVPDTNLITISASRPNIDPANFIIYEGVLDILKIEPELIEVPNVPVHRLETTIYNIELGGLYTAGSSITFLHGGEIDYMQCLVESEVHIYGYQLEAERGRITGYWEDWTPINITMFRGEPYYGHVYFHEIPEPTSIGILGIGLFFFRKKL